MYLTHTLIIAQYATKRLCLPKSKGQYGKKIDDELLKLSFLRLRNTVSSKKVYYKTSYINDIVSVTKTIEID